MSEEEEDEMIKKTIAQQEAKIMTIKTLRANNLPIPPDLQDEVGDE